MKYTLLRSAGIGGITAVNDGAIEMLRLSNQRGGGEWSIREGRVD